MEAHLLDWSCNPATARGAKHPPRRDLARAAPCAVLACSNELDYALATGYTRSELVALAAAQGGEALFRPADELEARRRTRAKGGQHLALPAASRDLVELFVDRPCMLGAGYEVPIAALYEAYVAWCKTSGRDAASAHGFARDLKAAFPQLATGRALVPDGRVRTCRSVRLRQVQP